MGIVWRFRLSFLCSLNPHPRSGHQQHQTGDEQHDPSGTIHGAFSHKTSRVSDVFASAVAQLRHWCRLKWAIPRHYHKCITIEDEGQELSELLSFE